MKESDIQDYLFENPDFLFPNQVIQEKAKEYQIKGKRIDLLFRVNGQRYIVEIKNTALHREHIGQIVEYYGLMKLYLHEANLNMILVSPYIEEWQKTYLEELSIKCIVFDKELDDVKANGNNSQPFEKTRNKKHPARTLWFVSVEYNNDMWENQVESKRDELKPLFKNTDSSVYIITFPASNTRQFVRNAQVGDLVIMAIKQSGNSLVYPPKEIIHSERLGSDCNFYIERSAEHFKKAMRFEQFNTKIMRLNPSIKISKNSTKEIPAKYVKDFMDVWDT